MMTSLTHVNDVTDTRGKQLVRGQVRIDEVFDSNGWEWIDDLTDGRGQGRINDVIGARVRIDDVTGAPSPATNKFRHRRVRINDVIDARGQMRM